VQSSNDGTSTAGNASTAEAMEQEQGVEQTHKKHKCEQMQ
jgi:hypothetical protein